MLIKPEALNHWINNFYGFGSWKAPIWFIGYEEGGGDLPQEVSEKFGYFERKHPSANAPTLCDIRELYKSVAFQVDGPRADLFTTLYEYRFDKNGLLHGAWKNLIAFVHGYRNKKVPDLLKYQKNSFAAVSDANEALIQLYPLPSPHNHAWYYSWLDVPPEFKYLKTRALYEEHLYPARMHTILENIKSHRPNIVLMYGMNNINELKKSVVEFFPSAKFKTEKAVKLQIPQYHRADVAGTTILITTQVPTLRHNRIETGFDWEELGKRVKEQK